MPLLELRQISKKYGTTKVINDLSFSISSNQIFGLLGPNGAGKTTLMRLLSKIVLPDSGAIYIDGEPFQKAHIKLIGYMPEERGLYRNMRVLEHLIYISKLHGLNGEKSSFIIEEWLSRLEMTPFKNRFVGELSKGMSQKIQFIATVLHEPKVLILDEPFSGLDPVSAESLQREIVRLRKEGVTIVLSTHRMDQIEHFCDNVLLINRGRKVIEGDVIGLRQKFKKDIFRIDSDPEISDSILHKYQVVNKQGKDIVIKFKDNQERQLFLNEIISSNIFLTAFNEILPSMNNIFIEQIKNGESSPSKEAQIRNV